MGRQRYGILHGLQVDICSTMDLRRFQEYSCLFMVIPMFWHLEHLLLSLSTELGSARLCSGFYSFLNTLSQSNPPSLLAGSALGDDGSVLESAGSNTGTASP